MTPCWIKHLAYVLLRLLIALVEWMLSCEEDVHDDPDGPDIDSLEEVIEIEQYLPVALALNLFRGHVAASATPFGGIPTRVALELGAEAEVCDLDRVGNSRERLHKDICRF